MSGNSLLRPTALFALALAAGLAWADPVAVLAPLSQSADPDRTFVDIPLAKPDAPVAALTLSFSQAVPAGAVRGVSLHLRSHGGWLAAQLPSERACGTVRVPFGAFTPESGAGPAAEADLVRVSLWRRAPDSDTPAISVSLATLSPPASVVVVHGTGATAPGEADFAAQMATRLERILARASIPFDSLPDTALDGGSRADHPSFILLPYSPSLSAAHIAALHAHVRAGGRIIAFYNGSRELSALLGLEPPRYEHSAAGWTALSWHGRHIPHHTENLLLPATGGRDTEVLASWTDAKGAETSLPAVVATSRGALFAHVPPLAFPAAQDLLATLLGTSRTTEQGGRAAPAASVAPALASFPIVGAWVPASRLPADIPPALNTLYAYLAALPVSSGGAGNGASRPLPATHVWLPLLNPVDRPNAGWLDPAAPATRGAIRRRIHAALLRHPAGLHFDYLRTAGGVPVSPEATAAVTALLREVVAAVRAEAPDVVLSAAVFPTPASAAEHNQDWPAWLREGLLDYVVPMLYADDPAVFRASLAECLAAAPADRLVAGVGTGADEAQVDAEAFAAEIAAAAEAGLRGVVFFPLDAALRELLPVK